MLLWGGWRAQEELRLWGARTLCTARTKLGKALCRGRASPVSRVEGPVLRGGLGVEGMGSSVMGLRVGRPEARECRGRLVWCGNAPWTLTAVGEVAVAAQV